MINPFTELWNLFTSTQDNKDENVTIGFRINKHLWALWSTHCSSKGKSPNQEIEPLIKTIIEKEIGGNKNVKN